MNKYSKLSKKQLLEICKLINPKTKWKFHQLLDNDGKGTDDCLEFISNDNSCVQFNIHQKENNEVKCYLNGNWRNDKIPTDKLKLIDKYLESVDLTKNEKTKKTEIQDDFDLKGLSVEFVNYFQLLYKVSIICFESKQVNFSKIQIKLKLEYIELDEVISILEKLNILSGYEPKKNRKILVSNKKELIKKLNEFVKIEKIRNEKNEKEKIKNESILKLKKYKELLELELISQKEYDNHKQELRKFIMED